MHSKPVTVVVQWPVQVESTSSVISSSSDVDSDRVSRESVRITTFIDASFTFTGRSTCHQSRPPTCSSSSSSSSSTVTMGLSHSDHQSVTVTAAQYSNLALYYCNETTHTHSRQFSGHPSILSTCPLTPSHRPPIDFRPRTESKPMNQLCHS